MVVFSGLNFAAGGHGVSRAIQCLMELMLAWLCGAPILSRKDLIQPVSSEGGLDSSEPDEPASPAAAAFTSAGALTAGLACGLVPWMTLCRLAMIPRPVIPDQNSSSPAPSPAAAYPLIFVAMTYPAVGITGRRLLMLTPPGAMTGCPVGVGAIWAYRPTQSSGPLP